MTIPQIITAISTLCTILLMVYVTRVSRRTQAVISQRQTLGARSTMYQSGRDLAVTGGGHRVRVRDNGEEWWMRDGAVYVQGPREFTLTSVCPHCRAEGLHLLGDRCPVWDAKGQHEQIDRECFDCGKTWQERTEAPPPAPFEPQTGSVAFIRPLLGWRVAVGDYPVHLRPPHPVCDRIDSVVLHHDRLEVVVGSPATSPCAPYMEPVADVRLRANASTVYQVDLVDRRRMDSR